MLAASRENITGNTGTPFRGWFVTSVAMSYLQNGPKRPASDNFDVACKVRFLRFSKRVVQIFHGKWDWLSFCPRGNVLIHLVVVLRLHDLNEYSTPRALISWLVGSVARIIRKANGFACELFVCPADCFVTAAKFWELVMLKKNSLLLLKWLSCYFKSSLISSLVCLSSAWIMKLTPIFKLVNFSRRLCCLEIPVWAKHVCLWGSRMELSCPALLFLQ